ncbi:MAG: hypothetical protein QM770_09135 [Tepidisphaeraceae bacterium]
MRCHIATPLLRRSALLIVAAVLCTGCQATRYALVSPYVPQNEVTPDKIVVLPQKDGLDYEFTQVEDKLVLRFVNRTGKPVELLPNSLMIDSRGVGYPIAGQTLAPDSAGRVVLPPRDIALDFGEPAASEEPIVSSNDDGLHTIAGQSIETYHKRVKSFDWPADQTAKVRLDWSIAGDTKSHEFTVRRSKN